jgi:TrmH family RNA methyltransferase
MMVPSYVSSRDNPLIKEMKRLAHDTVAYRKNERFWIEGDHLCDAAIKQGLIPRIAVFSEEYWSLCQDRYKSIAIKNIVINTALYQEISTLDSPSKMGFVMDLPKGEPFQKGVPSVILDRLQDAGNVGSILRSAAAFGFRQVIALKGTAALWAPKVLRAGMGAHFGLHLHEALDLQDLEEMQLPFVVTSSHQGQLIQHLRLPNPCAWVLGHEGQGVCPELIERAAMQVRIGQPGGEESLNVAAAAAICLHLSSLTQI